MTYTEIKDLREQRTAMHKQAGEIISLAASEKRSLTADESEKFDKLHADADALEGTIERMERQQGFTRSLDAANAKAGREDAVADDKRSVAVEEEKPSNDEAYNAAFNRWLRNGNAELTSEERSVLQTGFVKGGDETRALGVGTASAGGYAVAENTSMMRAIREARLAYGNVEAVSTTIDTSTGGDLPIPTVNDTSNVGVILAENTQVAEQDIELDQVVLGSYLLSSKMVRVSIQLLQDSEADIGQVVGRLLGRRLARGKNIYLTTGTGTAQPTGVVTASVLGVTADSTTAIAWPELIDLEMSVDQAYAENARFMFNRTTQASLRKLVDSDGRPLFQSSITVGAPNTVGGRPYVINPDMADPGAGEISVLYGDFSNYYVRNVRGTTIMQLRERFADYHQVAFLAFERFDADLVDAGTNPIKHLIQAAA